MKEVEEVVVIEKDDHHNSPRLGETEYSDAPKKVKQVPEDWGSW